MMKPPSLATENMTLAEADNENKNENENEIPRAAVAAVLVPARRRHTTKRENLVGGHVGTNASVGADIGVAVDVDGDGGRSSGSNTACRCEGRSKSVSFRDEVLVFGDNEADDDDNDMRISKWRNPATTRNPTYARPSSFFSGPQQQQQHQPSPRLLDLSAALRPLPEQYYTEYYTTQQPLRLPRLPTQLVVGHQTTTEEHELPSPPSSSPLASEQQNQRQQHPEMIMIQTPQS
ncbi:hypothetical protein F5B21DRAFT_509024 [Xylaria acuta]|nr:hypothetical protein F5B21DRAFT_509024 [Xylaria acuta]